jgi:hypothetical protein
MRFTTILNLGLTLAAASFTFATVQLASKDSGSPRPLKQYSMEQFMATTTVNGASFSADGKSILFSSNESGIFNVYRMPVAGGSQRHSRNRRPTPPLPSLIFLTTTEFFTRGTLAAMSRTICTCLNQAAKNATSRRVAN